MEMAQGDTPFLPEQHAFCSLPNKRKPLEHDSHQTQEHLLMMEYERLVCQRETLESCSGRFVWGSERITPPCWGMYFVAAALESISILQALYISSEITWNYIYQKFRAKWSIFENNASTEAFGRLEYIRITDNAGNEFKAQRIGLCQISKFNRNPKFEIPFSGKCIDKLKTYFCPSLTRSLLTRARIGLPSRRCGQNHGAHPTIKCLSIGWTDMSWEQM